MTATQAMVHLFQATGGASEWGDVFHGGESFYNFTFIIVVVNNFSEKAFVLVPFPLSPPQ